MFNKWLIIRSGFRQHRGSAANGCVDIYGDMCEEYGGDHNQIILEPWNACAEHTADFVYRLSDPDNPPQVAVFAYSWGAGYGLVKLAKELRSKHIHIRYAVLCDPVYHGLAVWRALLPRVLFHRVKIKIPSNIEQVWWLRQYETKPAGHDLVAEGPYTRINKPVVLEVPHTEMDNTDQFLVMCRRVARKMFLNDDTQQPA